MRTTSRIERPQQRSSNTIRLMMIWAAVSLTVRIRSAPPTTSSPPMKSSPATIRKVRAGTRVEASWIDARTRRLRGTCALNIVLPSNCSLERGLRPLDQYIRLRGDGQQHDHHQRVL